MISLVIADRNHFEKVWPLLHHCLDGLKATATKDDCHTEWNKLLEVGFCAFAECDGEVIGIFTGRIMNHVLNGERAAHDTYWFVKQKYRGLGVGTLLVKTFESWAKVQGCNMLCVNPSLYGGNSPEKAKETLEHLGYSFFGYQMRKKI